MTDYVVLEVETTGLDPAHDRMVQSVAIRYRAGQPNAAINLYVSPSPIAIPLTVQAKLGLTRQPELLTCAEWLVAGGNFEQPGS